MEEWKRRKAKHHSLVQWARHCGFEPAAHHKLLISKLEAVVRGDIHKLAVFMPPGTAKSTYASVLFPPWFLAQRPGLQILACSHSIDKAGEFSRKARGLVSLHKDVLGYDLSPSSKSVERWETNKRGEYQCAGVGTGIAGFRAHLGLIDDPIGKKEDADSKLIRDKQWDWYQWDFKKRLQPGAAEVLIQTRWHEDDLAGRLLAFEKDWTVVNIPLIAEQDDCLGRHIGEPIWPEYFDARIIEERRKSPGFSAQEQQRPAPEEGDYFKRDWILEYNSMAEFPRTVRNYAASDHACKKKQQNDRGCLGQFSVDCRGDIWIRPETIFRRMDTGEMVGEMLGLNKLFQPIVWWAEDEMIMASVGPFLNEKMLKERNFIPIVGLHSSADLVARAQSIRGRMRARTVHFPAFAPWYHEALHELLSFPVGTHDDFVAMLAEIGQGLDKITYAKPAKLDARPDWKDYKFVPTIEWLKECDKRKTRQQAVAMADW